MATRGRCPSTPRRRKLGLPIAFHTGRDPLSPNLIHCPADVLGKIADLFPRLTIIAAHMGGMDTPQEAAKHLAGKKNVYFDTAFASHFLDAASFTPAGEAPRGRTRCSLPRTAPGAPCPAEKALLEAADLSPSEKERIGRTATRRSFSASPFDIFRESG